MSTHEDFSRREEGAGSSDRSFGLVFAVLLTVIALWPLGHGAAPRWWVLAAAAILLAAVWLRPSLLRPANRAWTRLGLLLSRVVNPVITALLFYLVFVPIGLFLRLRGKDPLHLRFDPQAGSYWMERRPPGPSPETMSRQF